MNRVLLFAALGMMTESMAGSLTYLALGDSYTIGEGVAAEQRWPLQLARGLREVGIVLAEPRIIARTGWTTDELSASMDAVEPLGQWQFVSLLIGVNNQYRGRSVEDFSEQFTKLLVRAIALAGGRADRVLVLAIPDWGVTPFAQSRDRARIARELDAYNAAQQAVCLAHGVAFVDTAVISREHGATWVADDGLHPSAALYTLWAKVALPAAQRLLADATR